MLSLLFVFIILYMFRDILKWLFNVDKNEPSTFRNSNEEFLYYDQLRKECGDKHEWSMRHTEGDSRYWFTSEIPFPNCQRCGTWMAGDLVSKEQWDKFVAKTKPKKSNPYLMSIQELEVLIEQYHSWLRKQPKLRKVNK